MSYLLALDQGTTSSRAILFDLDGNQQSIAQQEFTQHYPRPGWVEHNADEIWESQLATAQDAISKAGIDASDVKAIGITNQRETTVIWDRKTGKPLHRAIVWQDRRTAEYCDTLKGDGHEKSFREKTGLVIDPYFSGTKIRWLLENDPELKKRASSGDICVGTIDSWLIYKLTGGDVHATDVSNASRTLLYNINDLDWDDDLLSLMDIPRAILPEVKPTGGAFGETDRGLLGASIPITGSIGDQQSALFGQACFSPGMAKNTYGTGSFVLLNTGSDLVHGDGVLTTIGWQIENGGKGSRQEGSRDQGNVSDEQHSIPRSLDASIPPPIYALEASIFVTGAAVQWLRDGLGLIKTSAEVEDLAASVEDNGGVYFVPALAGLGAPHWDPYARGTIVGLTRGSTAAHLARATLEAMAYQSRDGLEAMERASGIDLKELRVDGGAANNNMLLQFQADMLNRPVLRPSVTETTALGAANMAAIGADLLTLDDLSERWKLDQKFEARMDDAEREELYRKWTRAVKRSLGWANDSKQ